MTDSLTITKPDDWHIHLRDEESLPRTVSDAANTFQRAIVMPNLVPPITNRELANAYRQRILTALPPNTNFEPLMVLYLTDNTTAATIEQAAADPTIVAAKLYPSGATTNSDSGVTNIDGMYDVFAAMEKRGLVLAVHGEVNDSDIDIFDREQAFIDRHLSDIVRRFPGLRIVFEHISTSHAVDFVLSSPEQVGATITAHHLLFNRNDMLAGGIRPHYYCLPVLKRHTHQLALVNAATSGNRKFFLGTDSAPHTERNKENACGCAGSYTAYSALELYTEVFDRASALDKLEAFCSHFGADFYQLPRNKETVTLEKNNWQIPEALEMGGEPLIPLMAGQTLNWKITQRHYA